MPSIENKNRQNISRGTLFIFIYVVSWSLFLISCSLICAPLSRLNFSWNVDTTHDENIMSGFSLTYYKNKRNRKVMRYKTRKCEQRFPSENECECGGAYTMLIIVWINIYFHIKAMPAKRERKLFPNVFIVICDSDEISLSCLFILYITNIYIILLFFRQTMELCYILFVKMQSSTKFCYVRAYKHINAMCVCV